MIIKNKANINDRFILIDREIIEDTRLSFNALGIWSYLASRKSDLKTSVCKIESGADELHPSRIKECKDLVRSGIQELCKYGYLPKEALEILTTE